MSSPTREQVTKAFGEVLNKQLVLKGRPRGKVARNAHITRSYLYKLSRGHEQPSVTVFLAISDALGLHPTQLLNLLLERLGGPLSTVGNTHVPRLDHQDKR